VNGWEQEILGRNWTIRFVNRSRLPKNTDGLCQYEPASILINGRAKPWRALYLVLHELIHARMQDLDEEAVSDLASILRTGIGRLLTRMNEQWPERKRKRHETAQ